jgi:hypothetical protein
MLKNEEYNRLTPADGTQRVTFHMAHSTALTLKKRYKMQGEEKVCTGRVRL